MLVPGILGFQGLLLTLIFVVCVVIRHKWKDAAAKKEEIMRLVAMASEEAAMIEVEATVQYGSIPVALLSQCAVCYSPTTMRCSQCKAARYCSGKCQIMHWRQGHKDECFPPIDNMPSEEESDFGGKSILEKQSEINDTKGLHTGFASPSASLSAGTSPSRAGSKQSVYISSNQVIRSGSTDELEKSLSDHVAPDMVGTTSSFNVMEPTTVLPTESTNLVNCVDSVSCASKSSKKKSGHIDERADFKSHFSKPNPVITNDVKPKELGNSKPTTGSTLAGKLVADASKFRCSPSGSDSVAVDGEDDSELFKRKEVKSLSSNAPNDRPSSAIGGHLISNPKSAKIEGYHSLSAKVGSIPSLPQNVRNGLKTSVRKVVQQFRSSKESKPNLLDHGNEIGGKYKKAREGYSPLSPIGILSKIHKIGSHLGHGREEDAHEFLRYAVDTMQSVCLKGVGAEGPVAEETTLVGLTFGGYLRSKIKCMKCLVKSERYERMMDLTVEIDGDIGTLEEALTQFTATETLDRDNKYYCGRCKSYEKARKKLTILEVPNILTIVLKRFRSGNFEKLNKSIQFPEVLDMAPFISGMNDKSPLYSLYAVVVHLDIMDAAFSGHYVCYVKNFSGEWFRIDDSTVEPVELERVLLEGAYMLLYARHSPRAPSFIKNDVVSHGRRLKTESNAKVAQQKPARDNNQSFHPDERRFHSIPRFPAVDSSSESSSLFGSSDASSCSTASTKDSASTGDLSDYIFGEAGPNWRSHYGLASDSVSSSSYCDFDADSEAYNDNWRLASRQNGWREGLNGDGNSATLYTDTTRQRRKSFSHFGYSSTSRDTDLEQFAFANPPVVNSGVSLRRASVDRSAQTFY
uniref:USP domain-containing protein n=1 Tax=Fagus sylvatica TaxID=28930 RepID=A0A2N9ENU9_FAGSY